MEVEEETTSNHFEESIAAETTTVINEILLENTTSIDIQSEKELPELVPESTSQEKEDSPISVPKPEGSEAFVSVAVEEEVEEIGVHCQNSESVAALSDGVENSDMVESINVVLDSKDGDDGAVQEIDAPSDDVAAVECGGSELTCSDKVDGGVGMEAVAEEKCDLDAVDENVENDGEHSNVGEVLVIEKNENEGDEILIPEGEPEDVKETVKQEEGVEVLKGGDEGGVVLSPVVHNGEGDEFTDDQSKNDGGLNVQLEDAVDVQEMVGSDDRNDGGGDAQVENIDNLQVKEEEPVVTEDVKEEEMVPDKEEEAVAVTEDFKEEPLMANEETADVVAEKEEEETMVEDQDQDQDQDEEKSLDTEMETDKSVDTDIDTEKSVDVEMETEEEANLADQEKVQEDIETESELPESSQNSSGGKRKRGGKNTSKSSVRKTIEEDVCFICFDGGDLVLCDRRNCPKAYHPSCVNRDEAFFQSKGSWNCGWHLCSICEKKAEYMCYTCTYSVCKSCIKTSDMLCVREKEKKGLCEACMRTVMLIENPENQENVNFEDENSWEHLFKDYWTETKAKHDLSLPELLQAKKQESLQSDTKEEGNSDNPPENPTTRKTRRQTRKQKSYALSDENTTEWVSKELLDLITHMKNGDSSVISQYEVQDLLLEYIKRNKLRDPNKKSQIICDTRLEAIFGKPRVAHIEMLKLLESHFLAKEDSSQVDDFQGSVVDDDESNEKDQKDKKRKGKKKGDKKGPQSNREDYAAIDNHNISLIYLKRKLVEDLLDDMGTFGGKIVGTFVRIRISGANQKQDIYRLVQVTGTSEAAQYTLGKRTTCIMLEILNLDKTEIISIDTISNQEFTEDECKRLRQSIKCGLISRLTVGDILDKAMELQAARVNDWLETETVRLSHLRDRASDMGRKKELRECVEKLNVLKMPEERARKLEEIPLIHDDPTMDPQYESEDDTAHSDDNKQDLYKRSDSFRFNKRGRDQRDQFSPRGDYNSNSNSKSKESWTPRKNYDFTRNKSFPMKTEDTTTSSFDMHTESPLSHSHLRDPHVQQTPIKSEKPNLVVTTNRETTPVVAEPSMKSNDSEKIWHYKDPSGKIQGPFSMGQLRKWSKNGYFPARLIIWKKTEKEDDGIVLTDALDGNFEKPKPTPETRQLPSPTPNNKTPTNLQSPTPNNNTSTLVPCVNKDMGTSVGPVAVAMTPQNPPPQGWNSNNSGGVQVNNNMPYNQWTGMVPDASGNFMPAQVQPPNVSWQNMQLPQQQPQPQQVQPNWGTMAMSPNMMWAPAPNTGMAWGPMVQGPQVTATVDPTWVAATQVPGWIPQPPVPGAPNQTWVAPNNSWVYPTQNQIQGPPGVVNSAWNQGWVQPVANQGQVAAPAPVQVPAQAPVAATTPTGSGNSNQNWGPRNNQGNWGGRNDNRGGGYSGQRRNQGSGFHGGNNNNNNNRRFNGGGGSGGDSARSSDR